MANVISIMDVQPGVKLTSHVYSPLGGLLLQKGKVLDLRDVELIRAFLVTQIEVEDASISTILEKREASAANKWVDKPLSPEQKKTKEVPVVSPQTSFHHEYQRMLQLTRNASQSAFVAELPLSDLRHQLEVLIDQLPHYRILTFTPRNFKESDYFYHNAILSSLTSYQLAKWHGLPQKDWMQVAFAGLLHDIGNTQLPLALLYKPAPLTPQETEEMRRHTSYGYQQLRKIAAINEGVKLTALQHHEKMDGSGYPFQLTGDQIHIYAKIVGVADIFHAMTLKRSYRETQSPYLVLEELRSEAFGKLDPGVVQTFVDNTTQFHQGTHIRLNDGRVGEIVFSDRSQPTRPMVVTEDGIVNLMEQRQLYIDKVISN
ncbi:HD-GYP domain-containing protein [Paenibacillus sanguinis]|uniref:HD-GYP domain-containing protein n=1 Tax=Paenibacillus sanguinis TaxID=225906 RepID=UPI0003788333|nr:HD-GYP domain-containing protein [Paenibacillus sanguinis]